MKLTGQEAPMMNLKAIVASKCSTFSALIVNLLAAVLLS
jgi:hypothetical protein